MRVAVLSTWFALSFAALAMADDGPKVLFDGKSTEGWEHIGPGKFVLADGILRTEGGMGLLWYTKEKFGDCVLKIEYRTTDKSSNSGVFVRIGYGPVDEWYAVHHGYEVQICDSADEFHRTGAVYSLSKADAEPGRVGEWNTLEITLDDDLVKVSVNGEPVNTFDPSGPVPERTKDYDPERGPRPASGYIGLQNHDDYSDQTRVEFRRVEVAPLPKD